MSRSPDMKDLALVAMLDSSFTIRLRRMRLLHGAVVAALALLDRGPVPEVGYPGTGLIAASTHPLGKEAL